ncbi:uncharacterized protein JCM10292_006811 [Rhodotorula paludigena]|uniref:uncharacterized protein n=1 Tax=Rhodotorula paludigena TaxID=86838 RepID=UPI0031801D24
MPPRNPVNEKLAGGLRKVRNLLRFPKDTSYIGDSSLHPLAGKRLMPGSLISKFLTTTRPTALNQAVRCLAGFDPVDATQSNSIRFKTSPAKKEFVAENPVSGLSTTVQEILKTTAKQGMPKLFPETLQLITEVFVDAGVVQFKDIKEHLSLWPNYKQGTPKKYKLVEYLVSLSLFYGGTECRQAALVILAGVADMQSISSFDQVRHVYSFDVNDPNSINVTFGKVAKKNGYGTSDLKNLLGLISQGVKITDVKTASDEVKRARKFLDEVWFQLAKEGRAGTHGNALAAKLQAAMQQRNGELAKTRKTSGYFQRFSVGEYKAIVSAYRVALDTNSVFHISDAVLAVNLSSKYVRTWRQVHDWIGSHRTSIALALRPDYPLDDIWKATTIASMGFVKTTQGINGYFHASDDDEAQSEAHLSDDEAQSSEAHSSDDEAQSEAHSTDEDLSEDAHFKYLWSLYNELDDDDYPIADGEIDDGLDDEMAEDEKDKASNLFGPDEDEEEAEQQMMVDE